MSLGNIIIKNNSTIKCKPNKTLDIAFFNKDLPQPSLNLKLDPIPVPFEVIETASSPDTYIMDTSRNPMSFSIHLSPTRFAAPTGWICRTETTGVTEGEKSVAWKTPVVWSAGIAVGIVFTDVLEASF